MQAKPKSLKMSHPTLLNLITKEIAEFCEIHINRVINIRPAQSK